MPRSTSTKRDPILEKVSRLKPQHVLDVGCGCGCFTVKLAECCSKVVAIDLFPQIIERCRNENQRDNIVYRAMDARKLEFSDSSFDLVLERATLHHLVEWEQALEEMLRVSSCHVVVDEPFADLRNEAKKNTSQAQQLFLEVQREVGYPHYEYLPVESLIDFFRRRGIASESKVINSDDPIDFEEYFRPFAHFAEKSERKDYWFKRLDTLRERLAGRTLCENDLVMIVAEKQRV